MVRLHFPYRIPAETFVVSVYCIHFIRCYLTVMTQILLIEDDPSGRELAVYNLENSGYEVLQAPDGATGLKIVEKEPVALIITDVKMPGISGIDVLRKVVRSHSHIPVIVISAYADVEMAVEAMKLGATEFLGKPFSRDHLLVVVKKALESARLKQEVAGLRIAQTGVERPIIYKSQPMADLLRMTDQIAASEASVLITGPSGAGKELIARRIHARSTRALGPFVPVNLGAIPDNLVESELFGHVKGAFTGASTSRSGRFRQAEGGTLFLDEISELDISLQVKLLRALQERVVDPVGGEGSIPVDIRIVAATNRDLTSEIQAGRFREDLYFRINVVELAVPPLSQRTGDIPVLARHFVEQYGEGRSFHIPDEVFAALSRQHWRGNIRELENVCRRLVVLAPENTLRAKDLPNQRNSSAEEGPMDNIVLPEEGLSLMDLEKQVIQRVLALKEGNVSAAAVYLKVPRHVLAYRMEKYGLRKN